MQKLKRIKKWNCTEENYSNNKLGSNMTSSTEIADAAAALKPVIFPNWTTMPNTTSGSNSIDCSARQSIIDNSRSNSSSIQNKHSRTPTLGQRTWSRASSTVNTKTGGDVMGMRQRHWLLILVVVSLIASDNFTLTKADEENSSYASTTPLNLNENATETTETTATTAADWQPITPTTNNNNSTSRNDENIRRPTATPGNGRDSIFMRFAQRFSTGNELWDGIIRDCYQRPSYSCFQKNVYGYLNEALEASDVNVTQGLKFYKNQVDYEEHTGPTEAALAQDVQESSEDGGSEGHEADEHLRHNEIPHMARAAGETPIEEVTNALYGKSLKFAMTHDIELKLPEMMFDGATFRISPRSFEGNGIIAKLELIPKQEVQARLAGKIIMKKIQKFFKSKLLLSFLALVLIIKIIKIKLFWLLPLVVGVGAAKKLLLKFLLFLFPALSHLFKLCSYYQQTYHSTKYHHHHHLINHHHTVVPPWHNNNNVEHNSGPEIIYTQPPKGHISAYLHGAPIHETYGPPPAHEHFEGAWENSGPGLGSEYISDINRIAQVDENSNYFNPQTNDAHEIHAWGLGTTQPNIRHQQQQKQQQQQQQQRIPATQQQRPPPLQKQQHLQPQQYQKPHATSQSFNPFVNPDKHSIFGQKFKTQNGAQSAPGPVYTPARNGGNGNQPNAPGPPPQQSLASAAAVPGLTAAQIAAQYEPTRNNQQQQQLQQPLSPELSAQLKEAIRIQAEQRIISQQQKILEHQPFVQDGGQPIMPLNYDPFYSPILVKIDKIVEQLGVTDDLCKERLVCSMYKDPSRYSPHSNFVSSELSRDTSELQTVTNTNHPAVLRFYRLIQAARDGQDQRDCLRLYPQCSINTE